MPHGGLCPWCGRHVRRVWTAPSQSCGKALSDDIRPLGLKLRYLLRQYALVCGRGDHQSYLASLSAQVRPVVAEILDGRGVEATMNLTPGLMQAHTFWAAVSDTAIGFSMLSSIRFNAIPADSGKLDRPASAPAGTRWLGPCPLPTCNSSED